MKVPGYGPANARIVWIGESPGPEEVKQGKPWIGPSGQEARMALSRFGMDPDSAYYDNVVPEMALPFPLGKKGYELLDAHRDHLLGAPIYGEPRVYVLAGTWALRRFLNTKVGLVTQKNLIIKKWHGSTIYVDEMMARDMATDELPVAPGSLLIPVMHPAGMLPSRDPRRIWRPTFLKFIERAVKYAKTLPALWKSRMVEAPLRIDVESLNYNAPEFFIDFEFDMYSHVPHLLGIGDGSGGVAQLTSMKEMSKLLEKLITNGKRLIGHNVTAELRCIKQLVSDAEYRQAVVNVGDTMLLHSVIEPDLDHTLSFTARYCLDGISEWKWMGEHPTMEHEYNRLDVYYMTRAYKAMLSMKDVLPHNFLLPYKDALVALPRMMDIEDHGIRVNRTERDHLHRKFDVTIYDAQESVNRELKAQLELRLMETNTDVAVTQARIDELLNDARVEAKSLKTCDCVITFKTKPKKCPYCLAAYNDFIAPALAHAKTLRAHKGKVKKLSMSIVETGFRIGNDEDVRWYLRDVLNVKTKRMTDTGKMGVGVDDLEPFKDDPVIQHVWAAKHAKKMKSTFLDIPVDEQGFSHPRVNIHGAATGRPSSGRDKSAADDKAGSQSLAFNAFNLPEEIRSMFVPDDIDHVFVAGDYKDLEGRLVALDSGCRKLCEWYEEGKDVHSEVAALIFGCKADEARTKTLTFGSRVWTLRDLAKRAAHGDRYGMGLRRMCKLLHIPLAQGKEIRAGLRELLPEVYTWQHSIAAEVFGESRMDPRKGRRVWTKPPTRVVITKQQRIRYFPGVQNRVLKHAYAMRPQSHGAWIWYTLVDRLCVPWSTELRSGTGRFVIGTYDSAALSTRYDLADETVAFLRQAAEAEMTMFRDLPGAKYMRPVFPMDIKTGPNFAFPKEDKVIDYREDDDEEDSDE